VKGDLVDEKGMQYMLGMIDSVQPHVDEPVLACGAFSTAGSLTSVGVGKISPLASMLMRKKGKSKSGGLPTNVLVAVTATKAHIFGFSPRGSHVVVKNKVDEWDRRGMEISTEDKSFATRVFIHLPNEGRRLELDANKMSMGINEEVLRLLSTPVAPS
jgi:hypothetical protein